MVVPVRHNRKIVIVLVYLYIENEILEEIILPIKLNLDTKSYPLHTPTIHDMMMIFFLFEPTICVPLIQLF